MLIVMFADLHCRDFLVPHLELLGYAGVYTNKQGKVREGSATFWRTSRFRRLMTRELRMRELYKEVRMLVNGPCASLFPICPLYQQHCLLA
jgi:hypothetical protein